MSRSESSGNSRLSDWAWQKIQENAF